MDTFKRNLGYLMTFLFMGIIVFAILVYTRVLINPFTKVLETDMILSKDIVELGIRDIENIDVTFIPANATYRDIVWKSDDPNIAEVINGVIIAKSSGETLVTATSHENITKKIIVKVNIIPVKSVSLNKKSTIIMTGDTLNLKATIKPNDATYKELTWSSSNPSVATVTSSGKVKGIAVGSTTITVTTNNGKTASCVVKVVKRGTLVTGISLNQTKAFGDVGETINLNATIKPSTAINKNVTWTSSNESIATVNEGLVTLLGKGNVTITATSNNGKKAKCEIYVGSKDILPTAISLNQSSTSINIGDALNLIATISPSSANNTITWKSSNSKVATVDRNGKVIGEKTGQTVITATTINDKTASITVNVVGKAIAVTDISLSRGTLNVDAGDSVSLTATISPSNATNKNITWTSSNERVATVDANGNVRGISPGTSILTIKSSNGKTATCTVTVSNKVIQVTSVSIDRGSAAINVGGTVQLNATINPGNASDKSLAWTSSNTAVATVTGTGLVTGRQSGSATITVKSNNGKTASSVITVNQTSYTCSKGYYLGANATSCTLCEANYYCSGGTFNKSGSIQGRNACPSGQTSSAGSSSCSAPPTYIITQDSKYSSYKNIASYDSTTLKYRIIVYQGQDIVLIWAKDPRNQMHSALATSDGLHSKAGDVILKNEISTYGYQSKGMVAVNASFYRPTDNYNGTPWEGVLISHGKIVKNRDTCSGTIGLNSSGTLKLYYNETAEALYSYGLRDTFVVSNTTAADNSTDYTNRTQICQIDKNNFAILSGDGQVKACGKQLMGLTGCSVAFNLDGGGSRKLYYKTSSSSLSHRFTGDRIIPDMLYFVEQ